MLLFFSTEATQIIGMSATLSNINDLEQFLKAEVFSSDFRPVSVHWLSNFRTDVACLMVDQCLL